MCSYVTGDQPPGHRHKKKEGIMDLLALKVTFDTFVR